MQNIGSRRGRVLLCLKCVILKEGSGRDGLPYRVVDIIAESTTPTNTSSMRSSSVCKHGFRGRVQNWKITASHYGGNCELVGYT
jgi:hypothetical protein